MIRKIASLFLALLLVLTLCASAFAESLDLLLDFDSKLSDEAGLNAIAQDIYDSYGIAVVWAYTEDMQGMQGSELAEYLYDSYVSREDGLLLLHAPELGKIFLYTAGRARFLDAHFEQFGGAYDAADTYDGGVRDYLESVSAILEAEGIPKRDLVLISDDSAQLPAYDPAAGEQSGELLSLTGSAPAPQPQTSAPQPQIPAEKLYARVHDEAGVLSDSTLFSLNALADKVSEKHGCDVAVAFVKNVRGNIQADADDFFDYKGYGYGADDRGILLYIAVADREFAMSTHSYGAYAFTDYGLARLENAFIGSLGNNDWGGAAEAFIKDCDALLAQAATGTPYDINSAQEEGGFDPSFILFSVIAGFIVGCIPVASMKRGMKSVHAVQNASDYVRRGSFELSHSRDIFLRRSVNRVPKPKPQPQQQRVGGVGGSTMHVSSSGRSHGGRSGKF